MIRGEQQWLVWHIGERLSAQDLRGARQEGARAGAEVGDAALVRLMGSRACCWLTWDGKSKPMQPRGVAARV